MEGGGSSASLNINHEPDRVNLAGIRRRKIETSGFDKQYRMGRAHRIVIVNLYAIGLFTIPFFVLGDLFFALLVGLAISQIAGMIHGTKNSKSLSIVAFMGWLSLLGGLGLRAGGSLLVWVIFGVLAIICLNAIALYWEWQPPGAETLEERLERHRTTAGKLLTVGAGLLIVSVFIVGVSLVANLQLHEMVIWVLLAAAVAPGIVFLILAAVLRRFWKNRDAPLLGKCANEHPASK